MESPKSRRHPANRPELQLNFLLESDEAKVRPPKPISRLSIGIAALGVMIAVAASIYLYVAARDAMAGPCLNLPIDQVYVQRCGACHSAPPAEKFSEWGPRDWNRNVSRTMFMPGEEEEVHHYLERVGGKGDGAPSRTGRPFSPQ